MIYFYKNIFEGLHKNIKRKFNEKMFKSYLNKDFKIKILPQSLKINRKN